MKKVKNRHWLTASKTLSRSTYADFSNHFGTRYNSTFLYKTDRLWQTIDSARYLLSYILSTLYKRRDGYMFFKARANPRDQYNIGAKRCRRFATQDRTISCLANGRNTIFTRRWLQKYYLLSASGARQKSPSECVPCWRRGWRLSAGPSLHVPDHGNGRQRHQHRLRHRRAEGAGKGGRLQVRSSSIVRSYTVQHALPLGQMSVALFDYLFWNPLGMFSSVSY